MRVRLIISVLRGQALPNWKAATNEKKATLEAEKNQAGTAAFGTGDGNYLPAGRELPIK